MASNHMFIIFLVAAFVFPAITLAKEFIVGDESGWRIGFDYQAWAQGKEFRVGDKLVFMYPTGAHNVFKVNGTGFQDCVAPAGAEALATGNDVITLASLGRKWYICGVGKHCEKGGQKLAITVLPELLAPAPSPQALAPASSAKGIRPLGYPVVIAAMAAIVMLVMA